MKERIIKALQDALEAMNNEGAHWTQNVLRRAVGPDGTPSYCSLGALYLVSGGDLDSMMDVRQKPWTPSEWDVIFTAGDKQLRDELVSALAHAIPDNENSYGPDMPSYNVQECAITSWNDRHYRRWPEVVKLFERAQEQVAAREA